MTNSRVLAKLRAGEHVVVAGIGRVVDPWLSEVVGRVGYDCIWLDLEHPFPLSEIHDAFEAVKSRKVVKALIQLVPPKK